MTARRKRPSRSARMRSRVSPFHGIDLAEHAGRREEGGDVLRRGHGDAAFAAEAVVQRAVRGQRQDVVPDPIEPDDDCFTAI